MKTRTYKSWAITLPSAFILGLTLFSLSCKKNDQKLLKDFIQVNLVGNNDTYHPKRVEADLVNAWGIAFSPTGIAWVNAEDKGLSYLFDTAGASPRGPVAVPSGDASTGHPTGIVFNGSTDFKLPNGNPARFIFVGVDGILSGWNTGDVAVKLVDSGATSAYTGLAIGVDGGANFLYAANFKTGRIDVFDKDFMSVTSKPFTDPHLPSGYSPFNIQNVDGKLYVMYAKVDPSTGEEDAHPGFGIVDIYTTNGMFERRFVSNGQLNAPWGVAKVPSTFFSEPGMTDVTLIGNFGDGHINAYAADGKFIGQLREHGQPIEIEGLWAITFAPTTSTVNPNWLFFAAGPGDEENGLYGYITK